MAQSTIKNKRYSTSKKAQAERIKELEFRNFELERTLESVLQLIKLGLKNEPIVNHYSDEFNEVIKAVKSGSSVLISQKDLDELRKRNYSFKEEQKENYVSKSNHSQGSDTERSGILTPPAQKNNDDEIEKQIEEARIKREAQEATNKKDEELTPEQKEIERKKRLKSAVNEVDIGDMKKQVLEATFGGKKKEQQNKFKCSVCGVENEEVGYSEKLQKNYCLDCIKKSTLKY